MAREGRVYALCTPAGTPFYVGATVQTVRTRVGQHLRDARAGRKGSAVHELLASTNRCGFWVLEDRVAFLELGKRERHWTFTFERQGLTMLSYHHGANGLNLQPARVRARISEYAAKRPRGPRGEFLPVLPAIAGGLRPRHIRRRLRSPPIFAVTWRTSPSDGCAWDRQFGVEASPKENAVAFGVHLRR